MRTTMIFAAVAAVLCLMAGQMAYAQIPDIQNGSPETVADSLFAADSIPEGYELVDSVVYIKASPVDEDLAGENIFMVLPKTIMGDPADVKVHQSLPISTAMNRHFSDNSGRQISGYRVRIFFDNSQSARTESEATLKAFEAGHHDISAYRSYVNPYFKVTVGDFRTKSEAMQLLQKIKWEFPAAFIVKENINYPVVDKNNAVRTDTVKVLRPLSVELVEL